MCTENNMIMRMTKHKQQTSGFTLVELIVSVAVFATIMLISVGTLLVFIDGNAKSQVLYITSANVSAALDTMTREMRAGYHYYCFDMNNTETNNQTLALPAIDSQRDCSGGDFVAFTRESDGYRIGYRRSYLSVNAVNVPIVQKKIVDNGGGTVLEWTPITSTATNIDIFSITVQNSDTYQNTNNTLQAEMDIVLRARARNGLRNDTFFNAQTHITERRLDIL